MGCVHPKAAKDDFGSVCPVQACRDLCPEPATSSCCSYALMEVGRPQKVSKASLNLLGCMRPDLTTAAWRSVLPFVVGARPSALMAAEQSGSSLLWGAYVSLTSTVKQLAGASSEYERADEEDEDLIWDDDDDDDSPDCSAASTNSRQSYVTEEAPDLGPSCSPQALAPGNYCPKLNEQSSILRQTDLMALAAAVPLRHKWRDWQLLYSTSRDGISLKTLYRQAAASKASLLVVRDRQQQVFGCFASEMWRVAPRYYGTGECFVFQLGHPQLLCWRWWQKKMQQSKNDFFQFGTPEALAIGGGPHYAIRLDADLSMGSSGVSSTFGSPCLASSEEFQIGKVELWGLG